MAEFDDLAPEELEALRRKAIARRELRVRLARKYFGVFCEFVMKDERTNKPIVLCPTHWEWCRLMDHHDRLVVLSCIELGKTNLFAVARTLWELGLDPTLRHVILGNTYTQAKKIAAPVRHYIENSDELHQVFPNLLPGAKWGEAAFSVKGASGAAKDSSVEAIGVHGSVLGARIDRLTADDVIDLENSHTQDARQDVINWWPTMTGRLTADARVRIVGNPFHPRDLYHHLARQPGWEAVKFAVFDTRGESRWPERWPIERIIKKLEELGPHEGARQLKCEVRDDTSAKFQRAWIDLGLRLGEGTSLCSALAAVPRGYSTYTGVDLGVQQKDANDDTCLFTIAVDPYGVRSPLAIERGKWGGPDIVRRVIDTHRRFHSIVWVENNAAQDFIRQFVLARDAIPIHPFTTGRNKAHPEFGVESLAAEMAAGKWRIPNRAGVCHPTVQAWIDEMLYYDPAAHTGDSLMASWFAREGARKGSMRSGAVRDLDISRR